MLEECGLPYNMMPVNISKGEQFKPEFLTISPNNRMPAIVDPEGRGAADLGLRVRRDPAISRPQDRQVLSADERTRVEVDQWLMWQMGGLGPMAGQAHHFRHYAPRDSCTYAIKRYTDEVNRLYGVMNIRLADREFLAGKYSIADMACVGWAHGGNGRVRTSTSFRI